MKSVLSIPKQSFLFSLITVFFVVPYLILHGTNIVTHTYAFGVHRLFSGLSPYVDPQGAGDWFKYSPFFTFFYAPYAQLGRSLQAALWGVTNIVLFWAGVSMWFQWGKGQSKWLWLAFLFCSMEADGSFRYQQVNAALVGCVLISLALYRKQKYFFAGLLLAVITNIKLLPLIFLLGLSFPIKTKYLLGALAGLGLTFLIPTYVVGWERNLIFHQEWFALLNRDANGPGLLDIATILQRYGFSGGKLAVSFPIFLITGALMLIKRIQFSEKDWGNWISIGLLALLLVSPRTESPTFVLAGPTYLFLMSEILKSPKPTRWYLLAMWLTSTFLITLCMNDIWPRKIWSAAHLRYANKTFGVFLLWLVAAVQIIAGYLKQMSESSRNIELRNSKITA